jgi:hypothetical protein
VGSLLIQSDGRPGETHDPFSEVARDNLPRTPGAHKEIWGADAGKPTGQRFLLDVPNVRDQAHAWEIVRADALHGFGSILHSVTLQPSGYVSQGFRRKDQEEHL